MLKPVAAGESRRRCNELATGSSRTPLTLPVSYTHLDVYKRQVSEVPGAVDHAEHYEVHDDEAQHHVHPELGVWSAVLTHLTGCVMLMFMGMFSHLRLLCAGATWQGHWYCGRYFVDISACGAMHH